MNCLKKFNSTSSEYNLSYSDYDELEEKYNILCESKIENVLITDIKDLMLKYKLETSEEHVTNDTDYMNLEKAVDKAEDCGCVTEISDVLIVNEYHILLEKYNEIVNPSEKHELVEHSYK